MIALILAAALSAPVVSGAEVRPTFSGSHSTAAYMTVTSPKADRLLGVSCPCARSVELHQTVTENGVARMTGPAPVELPAGRPVVFALGGRHLMVMGLKAPIRSGDTAAFTLQFEKAGAVVVPFQATVGHGGGAESMTGMDHMSGMNHPH